MKGYRGNGTICQSKLRIISWCHFHNNKLHFDLDVDECTEGLHNCSEQNTEVCIDREGSFECVCRKDYIRNGSVCEDEHFQNSKILSSVQCTIHA